MPKTKQIKTDYLVIGSGLAGLLTALKLAASGKVVLISKGKLDNGSTNYAQGGIAAVTHSTDSVQSHAKDTMRAGVKLCNEEIVNLVVKEGPARVQELIEMGVAFSLRQESSDAPETFDLGLEGGHTRRRILHAADRTGQVIHRALIKKIRKNKNIQTLENHFAIDLLSSRHQKLRGFNGCLGAYVLDSKKRKIIAVLARATIMATGGAGKTYLYTSNPDAATGDGIAMAFRAGVSLSSLEFVQFHPTCLYHPYAKSFLVSEAVRGEGGILVLKNGERFMQRYHRKKELAPRDVVARAIDMELKKRGEDCVYLDIRHRRPSFLKKRFPLIYKQCKQFGIDITKDPIPVVPAAHYFCGGIRVNQFGQTDLPRLFAVGEVTYTGLHGANRLASNSLLECVVFAHRTAQKAKAMLKKPWEKPKIPDWNIGQARDPDEQVVISQNWDEIRRVMWNYVGIERSDKRLVRALRRIALLKQEIQEYYWDFIVNAELLELRNIALVGELVIRSALAREETRGLHCNRDHPRRRDQKWRKIIDIKKSARHARPPVIRFKKI